ncbi:MAG: hypothetical protein J5J06_03030 [Phycisphaerae bacterium]|nr:hypothetical protein [Phycisphaerae bacterium]
MEKVYLQCPRCGAIFESAFQISGSTNSSVMSCAETCRRCGILVPSSNMFTDHKGRLHLLPGGATFAVAKDLLDALRKGAEGYDVARGLFNKLLKARTEQDVENIEADFRRNALDRYLPKSILQAKKLLPPLFFVLLVLWFSRPSDDGASPRSDAKVPGPVAKLVEGGGDTDRFDFGDPIVIEDLHDVIQEMFQRGANGYEIVETLLALSSQLQEAKSPEHLDRLKGTPEYRPFRDWLPSSTESIVWFVIVLTGVAAFVDKIASALIKAGDLANWPLNRKLLRLKVQQALDKHAAPGISRRDFDTHGGNTETQ